MVIGVSFGEIEPVLLLFFGDTPFDIMFHVPTLAFSSYRYSSLSESRYTFSIHYHTFSNVDASPSASFPIN